MATGQSRKEYRHEYYLKNKAKAMAYNNKWQAKNIEKYKELTKSWRVNNREKKRIATRRSRFKSRYKISLEEYNAMLITQNYRCAVCLSSDDYENKKPLNVDHSHETGKVRGLLCTKCNRGIGQFRDSPILLAMAIQYLFERTIPYFECS